jgi:hypothetical protein
MKYFDLDKENMDRIPDIITDGKPICYAFKEGFS